MNELYGEARIGNVTSADLFDQDPDFQDLVLNLISIHVVSELYGADCFERSILKAPTPEMKMRMAKTVMEEYRHHLRFRRLLDELDIGWREFTSGKAHLTTFEVPIDSWTDQVVFLALVDRAAAHQFRHFVECPYEPFRRASQETLDEEYGHVGLGMMGVKQLLQAPDGREQVAAAVRKWLPVGLRSFGSDGSQSSRRYRYWGFKSDSNETMRRAYFAEVHTIVTRNWGIDISDDLEALWPGAPSA